MGWIARRPSEDDKPFLRVDVSVVHTYIALGYNVSVNKISVKYRVFPNHTQQRTLIETRAVCRDVYNSLVHERTVTYTVLGKSPTLYQQQKAMTAWKPSHPELATVHSQVLQNIAVRVELAFQAFFRRVKAGEEPGYPRLKGKGQYDSITYPQGGYSMILGCIARARAIATRCCCPPDS